jgi:tetratricopeptide (TPR) repeat protein
MKNRHNILLQIVILLSLFFGSCKTVEFGYKVIDISGMVYDFSNRPVANYELVLGRKYKGSTDINGRFTLVNVPVGIYSIMGSKSGYENYSDEIHIKERGQIIYIRIPSQTQLLNIVDDALTANNLDLAWEIAGRAYQIDKNCVEMLFYYAAVLFRRKNYQEAIDYLEAAVELGSKDLYIEKFLAALKEF